jgi:hypothetical protein
MQTGDSFDTVQGLCALHPRMMLYDTMFPPVPLPGHAGTTTKSGSDLRHKTVFQISLSHKTGVTYSLDSIYIWNSKGEQTLARCRLGSLAKRVEAAEYKRFVFMCEVLNGQHILSYSDAYVTSLRPKETPSTVE